MQLFRPSLPSHALSCSHMYTTIQLPTTFSSRPLVGHHLTSHSLRSHPISHFHLSPLRFTSTSSELHFLPPSAPLSSKRFYHNSLTFERVVNPQLILQTRPLITPYLSFIGHHLTISNDMVHISILFVLQWFSIFVLLTIKIFNT